MTDQHTPGPWTAQPDLFDGYFYIEAAGGTVVIADVYPWQAGDMDGAGEAAANARLIEAAPELLEACETLATLLDTDDWIATGRLAVKQARAAIAKVRGTQ
ncbi:MAG: hypothetical protein IOC86_04250 [Aestuariivirga sp.]|nr:hypothetical protein [Aestuariivirga sp.]